MTQKFKELWVEKYRPLSLDTYIFENLEHKKSFKGFIDDNSIPNLLLTGVQGTGKTTIAKILIDALNVHDSDLLYLNASDDNSVDVMRDTIKQFVSTYAIGEAGFKIVHLEEADYISLSGQAVLRRLMEDYTDDVRFVLTANYANKIKPAIKSRCQQFQFKSADRDDIVERIANILISESVDFELDDLDLYVDASYPDIRQTINSVQKNIHSNVLSSVKNIEADASDYKLAIMGHITNDDWSGARQVVCDNISNDEMEDMYRFLYSNLHNSKKFSDKGKWEEGQLEIAEYLYKHAIVADPEINLSALFISLNRI